MILTAIKPVNARLGKPSTNAPNPRFLLPGEQVKVVGRAFGDNVFGNPDWVITDKNEFITLEGFHQIDEIKSLPFVTRHTKLPELLEVLKIAELWSISKGEGVNIGVIDNGVAKHTSLKADVKELNKNVGLSEEVNGHGTTMACIIAASDNEKGKVGVAPMVNKIFSYTIPAIEKLEPEDLVIAMDAMMTNNVQILNLSFSCDSLNFFIPRHGAVLLQQKIDHLTQNGCVVVCATGNNRKRNQDFFPAKYHNVISVAGFNDRGNLDESSNLWTGVTVSISSDHYFKDSQFEKSNGTSGATALITGCIACVFHIIKGENKTQTLHHIFSHLPLAKPEFGAQVEIPKFDSKQFLQFVKQ